MTHYDKHNLLREWSIDGWELRAYRIPDDDPDMSHLGGYFDDANIDEYDKAAYSDVAREVPTVDTRQGPLFARRGLISGSPRTYYRPQRGCEESWRLDEARLRAYYREEWHMVGVVVTASRAGIVLGEGSLWGIESDSGDECMRETADELAGDAIEEGREKLRELLSEYDRPCSNCGVHPQFWE